MPKFIIDEGFDSLIFKYNTYFIDLWGIAYDGDSVFPNFVSVLDKLRKMGKEVRFLSNSPRRSIISQQRLEKLGLNIDLDEIVTSGEYFAHLISKDRFNKEKFFLIGDDKSVLDGFDLTITDSIDNADYILISLCSSNPDFKKWKEIMKIAVDRGIPAICTNPDIEVFHGPSKIYTPGYFAKHYENLGGEVIYFGKPHKGIYDFMLSKVDDSKKVLAIGDAIATDIKGANNAGIDSLWAIGCGIHKDISITNKMKILSLCQHNKCKPTYIMDKLV